MSTPDDDGLGFVPESQQPHDDDGLGFVPEGAPRQYKGEIPPSPTRAQRAAPADPGVLSTLGHALLSGFYKQGSDEASGKLGSAFTEVLPGAHYKLPNGEVRALADKADLYRASRDSERQKLEAGREHHPVVTFLGNMAGDIGSDAVLGAFGVPVGSVPYQVASGAISGYLGSDADLSEGKATPGTMASAALSTGVGAGLGYVLPKVGAAGAKMLPAVMARARQGLESVATSQGNKALLDGGRSLANRMPTSDAAVMQALEDNAIRLLGTSKGAYQRLSELADQRGAAYGTILEKLEELGVKGPRATELAEHFLSEARDRAANSGANKAVADVFAGEAKNLDNITPRDFVLLGESPMASEPVRAVTAPRPTPTGLGGRPKDPATGRFLPREQWPPDGAPSLAPVVPEPRAPPPPITPTPYSTPVPGPQQPNLGLMQAERVKRALQEEAKYGRIEDTPLNEAKKQIAAVYRKAIEDQVENAGLQAQKGSELAQLTEEFLPVKRTLSLTKEAEEAARLGAARSGNRATIGLPEYITAANAEGSALDKGWKALLLSQVRQRGASTAARGAYLGSRAAGAMGRMASASPQMAGAASRYLGGVAGRQGQQVGEDFLSSLLDASPESLGDYAPALAAAKARGPQSLAIAQYVLQQRDPRFRETMEAARKAQEAQQR